MPKIYELPASSGVENQSLEIRHAPGSPTAQRFNRQQQQQPQGSADPKRMLANQMDMELRAVTQQFDIAVSGLDQNMLEPDKFKAEYEKLQRQAASQRVAIQAKHQAAAQHIKNMQKLVEDGIMEPEQMQASMLTMAGIDRAHVKTMFAQQKQESPRVQLNHIVERIRKEFAFRSNFEDRRKNWLGKGLKYVDPASKIQREAKEEEQQAYDDSAKRIDILFKKREELFNELTPLEKAAQAGAQAVDRYGMEREPARPDVFGGMGSMGVTPPERKPTPEELMKKGTKEAYERGKKLGYWK